MEYNSNENEMILTVINGGKEQNQEEYSADCGSYEVGDRLIFQPSTNNGWGNWVIDKVIGKKIILKQLSFISVTKTYNLSYLNKLFNEKLMRKDGKLGEVKYLSDFQKDEILKLNILHKSKIEQIEELLLMGVEKCDLKIIFRNYLDDMEFTELIKIIYVSHLVVV